MLAKGAGRAVNRKTETATDAAMTARSANMPQAKRCLGRFRIFDIRILLGERAMLDTFKKTQRSDGIYPPFQVTPTNRCCKGNLLRISAVMVTNFMP